jgi:hypothetical protein
VDRGLAGRHRVPVGQAESPTSGHPLPLIGLPVTGLALVLAVFGYPASHWTEWLAGAAGVGIGHAGHHFATYLGERCDSLSTKDSC